jgi:hypothetical protein
MNAVDDLSKDAQAPGANSAWTGLAKHLQTVATAFGLSWPMGPTRRTDGVGGARRCDWQKCQWTKVQL